MGPVELYQDHTLGLACVTAKGIEIELKNQIYIDQLSVYNKLLQSVVDNYSSAVVTVNDTNCIQSYNTLFRHIFHLSDEDLTGKDLFTIIDQNTMPKNFRESDDDFRDQLASLSSTSGTIVESFVSATRIRGPKNEILNTLITIPEKKRLRPW